MAYAVLQSFGYSAKRKKMDVRWFNVHNPIFSQLQTDRFKTRRHTSDCKCSGALSPTQRAVGHNHVLSHVFGSNHQNKHWTHTTHICDVVVGVCVEAGVVSVPGNMWSRVANHSTAHVALVTRWSHVTLQRDDKFGSCLQVEGLWYWQVTCELFWKKKRFAYYLHSFVQG